MNTKMRFVLGVSLLVFPVLLTACAPAAPAASAVTVTVKDNTCTYDGPTQIASKVTFTLEVQDSGTDGVYNFLAVAASESKTADDLRAMPTLPPTVPEIPEGLTWMFYVDVPPGMQITQTIDFVAKAAYKGGDIYVVCGNDLTNIGVIGPFEVTD